MYVTGRPRIFETPEDMQLAVDNYFKKPTQFRYLSSSDDSPTIPVYTVSGLAYALGYESRQSIYDNKKNEEFSYILKRACLFIESVYEARLSENNPTGAIFALKNMGWKDKQEIDQTNINTEVQFKDANDIEAVRQSLMEKLK